MASSLAASLGTLIPATFPALVVAHFISLISPGPDFFLIMGHAVRHRLRGALFICMGITLGNIMYISLSILGWSAFRTSAFFPVLELVGACYLVWIGFRLIKSSRYAMSFHVHAVAPLTPAKQFATGFFSAILNPKNMIFYMTLMASILGSDVALRQQVFCGGWMAFAVLVWDVFVAACIGMPFMQRALGRKIVLVEAVSGVLLVLIGAGIISMRLYGLYGVYGASLFD